MQFYQALTFLHRPFVSGSNSRQTCIATNGTFDDSARICNDSATAICQLIISYRQHWSIRHVHAQVVAIILTAAIIHIHNYCVFSSQMGMQAQGQLSVLVQALGEMGHFNNSSRALEVIMSLRHEWQNRSFCQLRSKRLGRDAQRG